MYDFTQNQIWPAIIALAAELTAWLQPLALTGHDARRWEPKRLRLRLFVIPATLARRSRQALLHITATATWADLSRLAITRLRALAVLGSRYGASCPCSREQDATCWWSRVLPDARPGRVP